MSSLEEIFLPTCFIDNISKLKDNTENSSLGLKSNRLVSSSFAIEDFPDPDMPAMVTIVPHSMPPAITLFNLLHRVLRDRIVPFLL